MTAQSHTPAVHDVIVVGGGIGGLTLGWEVARAGLDVVVTDAEESIGGMLRRGVLAGVELDLGAESFATRTSGVVDLVDDARLPVQFTSPRPGGAHLAYRGRFGRVRRSPLPRRALIGMPADPAASDVAAILGRAGSRRALAERTLPVADGPEPSLADLVTSRYGAVVTERLVEPLCRSVYSHDAASVRLSALHPALWKAYLAHGSLTAAVDALAPDSRAGSAVRGIEGGLWRLAAQLHAAALRAGAQVRTGARVRRLRSADGATDVVLDDETLRGRTVVLATGPGAAADLLGVQIAAAAPVRLTVAEIAGDALRRHPVGSGVIVAPDVATPAKALTHVDAKWDWADAALPAGRSVVRLSARDGDAGGLETGAQVARAVRTLTGAPVSPGDVRTLTQVVWPDAVCPPATRSALATAAQERGIRLTGAIAAGTGLASVIPHARSLATDIIASHTPHEGARHVR